MRDKKKLAAVLVIFVLALMIRILFLIDLLPSPYFDNLLIDPASYDAWGRKIAAGDIWGDGVFYQAPLYAYFLGAVYAVFGHDLFAVRVVQSVLGSITCVMLLLLTSNIFSLRTGLLAGCLAALYTTFVFQDVMLLKSVVVLFFLVWSLLCLAGWTKQGGIFTLLQAGFLLGVAITGRGNLIFALPFLGAWILLREGNSPAGALRSAAGWRAAGAFLLGTAVAIAPVTIRNRVVGRDWVLVESDAGINVYVGNNPSASGIHTPPFDIRTVPEHEEVDAARYAEREVGRSLAPSEVSAFWVRKALGFVRDHPAAEARLVGRKLLLAWNGYEVPDNYDQSYFARISWIFSGFLPGFSWIAPFALFGFAASLRAWRSAGFLHVYVVSYLLSLLALYVTSRYRLPIVVGLLPLAAHGFFAFVDGARARAIGRTALASLLLLTVFFTGRLNLIPYRGHVKEETELATFYANAGDREAAERAFERAVVEGKGSGSLHLVYMNQGLFFVETGRPADAEEAFRKALAANPSFTPALVELRKLEAKQGAAPGPPSVEAFR
jgi:4-amino-4-deoxy-L-arabinose transferase-like glycosyltransferase